MEDLTFSFMLDSPLSETELRKTLLASLTGAEPIGGYIRYCRNILRIERNSLFDPILASAGDENSWLYFPYSLNVFPEGNASIGEQRSVAGIILGILQAEDMRPEFVSEFDL